MDAKCLQKDQSLLQRVLTYGRMIKFSHTVFALPFALSAIVLAERVSPIRAADILWILLAMIGARSAAMGFNRIADARLDAANPRTAGREIPAGRLSIRSAAVFVVVFSAIFVFAAAMLGRLCLYFSLPVLAVLFSYSYTKRFTWLCHIYLGFTISLAPLGAWIALTDTFSWPITLLCMALLTYIAGFDILYACQDIQFDTERGLFSLPSRLGVKKALLISSIIHIFSLLFFFGLHAAFDMGAIYLGAVALIGGLLWIEHRMVKPDDLSRVPVAFFHINSVISVILFAGILADELVRRC